MIRALRECQKQRLQFMFRLPIVLLTTSADQIHCILRYENNANLVFTRCSGIRSTGYLELQCSMISSIRRDPHLKLVIQRKNGSMLPRLRSRYQHAWWDEPRCDPIVCQTSGAFLLA